MSDLFEVELKNRLEFYLSIEKKVKKHFEKNERDLHAELKHLRSRVEILESEKKGLTARNSELFNENRELKEVAKVAEGKMEEAQKEAATAGRQLEGIKVKFTRIEKENADLKRDVKKLNALEPEKLKKKFNDVNHELKKNKKLLDQLSRESRERKRKLDKLTTDLTALEEKNKELEEAASGDIESADSKADRKKDKSKSSKKGSREEVTAKEEQEKEGVTV